MGAEVGVFSGVCSEWEDTVRSLRDCLIDSLFMDVGGEGVLRLG